MSETKLCKDCKHYRRPIVSPLAYFEDLCAYSVEDSPVNGNPLLFVHGQGLDSGPSVLKIRQEMCKGAWFEEKPIDVKPAKPWWRFW